MSIRNIVPHLLLALIALPSCVTETEDGDATHEADADTADETKPTGTGRDGGLKDDDDERADASDKTNDDDNDDQTDEPGDGGEPDEGDSSNPAPQDAGANPADDTDGDDSVSDAGINVGEAETTSFFLPTTEPDNTVAPRLEIDAKGGIHTVYPAYAGGGAYYAYCAKDCDDGDAFEVVQFPTDETVANAVLALSSDGKPRILLSLFTKTLYATCDDDCTDEANWSQGEVLDHEGDKEISGEALALDPDGNPHFISHTYRAYLGIGQKEELTHHHACYENDCTKAGNWTVGEIADQTWEESQLEFDADGNAHLAFVAIVEEENEPTTRIAAYATCKGECDTSDDWLTAGLALAYTDDLEAFDLKSSIALALTKEGKPRLVMLAKSSEGDKNLIYYECDAKCTGDGGGWVGSVLSDHPDINVGLDLALDSKDRPRFTHTLNYNIALAYCDTLPCSDAESPWEMAWVEVSSSIPKDDIILFPNCTVAAWFLHSSSLVLDANDNPYVGYQARDVSGGVSNPDPFEQDCLAGTDMTLTRMTQMVLD